MACLATVCFSLLVRFVIMPASRLQPGPQENLIKHDTLVFIYYILYIYTQYFPGSQLSCVGYIDIVCFSKKCSNLQTGEECVHDAGYHYRLDKNV